MVKSINISSSNPGLLADIGATHARFAVFNGQEIYDHKTLECNDYKTITDAVKGYISMVDEHPSRAAFAIAGPVNGDDFSMTNHPWSFSCAEVKKELKLDELSLFNDFEAVAMSITHFNEADLNKISGGEGLPNSSAIVMGPGSSLGSASLIYSGGEYKAVPGEGGHVTLPARNQREFDVISAIKESSAEHVSAERLCSGSGLVNIYETLRIITNGGELPDLGADKISEMDIKGECELCKEALDMMMGFLGVVAGDHALIIGARGGVYIGGGIINKLGSYFKTSPFLEGFYSKGRFESYLKDIPVFVIKHEFPAFPGLRSSLLT